MKRLDIVGMGPGAPRYLTDQARQALQEADLVCTTQRLADRCAQYSSHVRALTLAEIAEELVACGGDEKIAVAVSGDTGFYSFSSALCRQFHSQCEIRVISGISSLQLLCAKLKIPWEKVRVISLHGRNASVLGPVSYNRRTFVLTGGSAGTRAALQELCDAELGGMRVTLGENLGLAEERVRTATAQTFLSGEIAPLAVLLLHNDTPVAPYIRLRDEAFVRAEVPITKEPVRTLAVDRLSPAPNEIVYDIGAGTGSISVAAAYRAADGLVYAFERREDALLLIRENRKRFGAFNILPVFGSAPESMEGLPAPDCVFVGGSGGRLDCILDAICRRANPFRFCMTAITLETLTAAQHCMKEHGFCDVEIDCVNVSSAVERGGYHMMQAQNPVYLISGRWPS